MQGGSPYIVSGEASAKMTQMVAMEGGCFGLACCQVVSEKGAETMKMTGFPWFKFPGGGFVAVRTFFKHLALHQSSKNAADLRPRWLSAH
jgi:hypothetical protein